jgi:hypothetical protein
VVVMNVAIFLDTAPCNNFQEDGNIPNVILFQNGGM